MPTTHISDIDQTVSEGVNLNDSLAYASVTALTRNRLLEKHDCKNRQLGCGYAALECFENFVPRTKVHEFAMQWKREVRSETSCRIISTCLRMFLRRYNVYLVRNLVTSRSTTPEPVRPEARIPIHLTLSVAS